VSTFRADVEAQGAVVGTLLDALAGPAAVELGAVRRLAPDRTPVVITGMGSSLSASLTAAGVRAGRRIDVCEAGELLHYGLDSLDPAALVVLVSQSGRSAETLEVGRRLQARGRPTVAIVNDTTSPLAEIAGAILPMRAGTEASVAVRTWVATFVLVQALVDVLAPTQPSFVDAARAAGLPGLLAALGADPGLCAAAAEVLDRVDALAIIGRGPALAAAEYGALVVKETAALPAEAMSGGSFRHGPMEIAGPRLGVVVLAPTDATHDLATRLAADTAGCGSPTWLITDSDGNAPVAAGLLVTRLPAVPHRLVPVTLAVPLQHLAASLAVARGREPGVLQRSGKVTEVE
jgi:glutamine---fructose-6-phosphate transaminase (isomerizing)